MKKIIIFLVVPVVIVSALLFILAIPRPGTISKRVYSDINSTNYWQSQHFQKFTDSNIENIIKKSKIDGTETLSVNQSNTFPQVIADFLLMNQTHDFERYLNFRFGRERKIKGHFNQKLIQFYKSKIFDRETIPSDDTEVLRLYWNTFLRDYVVEKKISWAEIGNCLIVFKTAPPIPGGTEKLARKKPHWGVFSPNPVFFENETPLMLLKNNEKITFMTFSSPIRNENGVAAGIFLQFYWNPNDNRWVPWEYSHSGSVGFLNKIF